MAEERIRIAKNAGFCFGVKRATDRLAALLDAAKPGARICTLGQLIHNRIYQESIEAKGVTVTDAEEAAVLASGADAEHPVTVLIRAHGIECGVEEKLRRLSEENPYFVVEDCTCPYVKKVQRIAAENSGEGRVFLLIGAEQHPEVVGIMSYVRGEGRVFPDAEALESALCRSELGDLYKKKVAIAAQTTQKLSEWKKSIKILEKYCTNPIIFDTICSVTEIRQQEAEKLSRTCDGMVVIGSKHSSNTAKLYEICRANCADTRLVETADELREMKQFPPFARLGIAAGASTPGGIIEEVYKTMSENFAQMLEESLITLNTGDTVKGIVTSVTNSELQLDLGAKVTGIIVADQITDDPSVKLTEQYKVGDEIEAFVIRVSDLDGVATLSKKRVDANKSWQVIVDALASEAVLEGKVVEAVKGGVIALTNANRVFIPGAHTGIPKDGDLTTLVGQTVRFKIIEIKDRQHRAYGSMRAVLREERKAREAAFWAEIEEGKQYTGVVKSMTTYGAFVDLGGVDGMVHTSELSWARIKSPADVVSIGETLTVYVKSFDPEKKRISLGYKTAETNPWYIFTNKYAIGDVATVKIVNMMPFGAFAEIVEGVDGLIHISQIAKERIAKPADVLELGQEVDVKIIDINEEKHTVSLSIRALLEEAEAVEEPAAEADELVYSDDAQA
ncbi:MAG: bifunctional 4-hydroxy-3-methylbut-2-enyl diphosphate reductase/30S ribosomal protein S1 [Ruminococcaceae bacterium]|nr:bifunctional 4-hydroxy-3-methylbut-2-enyl diphosphate reductase/30S ribosomal protein S1 [Oscillospiraceae bacterium]